MGDDMLTSNGGIRCPGRSSQEELLGRSHLTTLELKIIELAQAGLGRNGIAAALGISANTVKTLRRRIRWKIANGVSLESFCSRDGTGEGWQKISTFSGDNSLPQFGAPGIENIVVKEEAKSELDRRQAALLFLQSRRGRAVLVLSAIQRFWLKPAVAWLEAERRLRLLTADRHEVFNPPWLPIVNRGRRVVRAAYYRMTETDQSFVLSYFGDYIQRENGGLKSFLTRVCHRLEIARTMSSARGVFLPSFEDLLALVEEAFGSEVVGIIARPRKSHYAMI